MNASTARGTGSLLGLCLALLIGCGEPTITTSGAATDTGAADTVPDGAGDAVPTTDSAKVDAVQLDTAAPVDSQIQTDSQQPDSTAPDNTMLCAPCTKSADCATAGGPSNLCVDHGPQGAFCGTSCTTDDTCPPNYFCTAGYSVEGQKTKQCQPTLAIGSTFMCDCSAAAVAGKLATNCYKEVFDKDGKLLGSCPGKRMCSDAGLTDCDATTPQAETCDGLDNDCDGAIDEVACDDGNACTTDACQASKCSHLPHKGVCEDDDACTVNTTCATGTCHGDAKNCDDGDSCTADICAKVGGCTSTLIPGCKKCKNNKECDDSDPCTDDICNIGSGACNSKPKSCDDGDSCTVDTCIAETGGCDSVPGKDCKGTLTLPFAAAFACNSPSNTIWTLDPPATGGPGWAVDDSPSPPKALTGGCSLNFNNGKDYACPVGAKGVSGSATSPWIDATGLPPKANLRMTFARAGSWQAGNNDEFLLETTTDGKTWTKRYDANPISNPSIWGNTSVSFNSVKDTIFRFRFRFFSVNCDANGGSGPAVDKLKLYDYACYADSDCITTSKCSYGVCLNNYCQYKAACDDNEPCTSNGCSGSTGKCTNNPIKDGTTCTDGDSCTSGDSCVGGKCSGAAKAKEGDKCNDGNLCTVDETCKGGVCQGKVSCDDLNPCTIDSCHAKLKTCVHASAAQKCDDGNACTSDDACAKGICSGKSTLCDDGSLCTMDSCNGVSGKCVYKGGLCDDGNSCTADACNKSTGKCSYTTNPGCGPTIKVPYQQPFECGAMGADLWHLAKGPGPVWAVDSTPGVPAPPGGKCTLNFNNGKDFACATGQTKLDASATSPWIDASAVKGNQLRLQFRYSGTWDNSGNNDEFQVDVSTDGSTWQKRYEMAGYSTTGWYLRTVGVGDLKGKKFKVRFRFYTADCLKNTGSGPFVEHVRIWDAGCSVAADCATANACQTTKCTSGACQLTNKNCNDSNSCTQDLCDKNTGKCTNFATPSGSGCSDGDACTNPDTCAAGKCWGGAMACDDGLACTTDSCDHKIGCLFKPICNDGDACTSDTCDEVSSKCTHKAMAAGAACADGDLCTGLETCSKGKCVGTALMVTTPLAKTWSHPTGIAVGKSGVIWLLAGGQHRLLRITDGKDTAVAGSGKAGKADGKGDQATFNYPQGLALGASGQLWVADTNNHLIRRVASDGTVTTVAGSVGGFLDGPAAKARFNGPQGIALDAKGVVFIADTNNGRIRRLADDGSVLTVAGSGNGFQDGPAAKARFNRPTGITFDAKGTLFVADRYNNRIRSLSASGNVATVSGSGQAGFLDGYPTSARFNQPTDVLVLSGGWLAVADHQGNRVRRVAPDGNVSTLAGTGQAGYVNGLPGKARFNRPWAIAATAEGDLVIADRYNSRVRRLGKAGANVCVDNNKCTADICDPATGACSTKPLLSCNDNKACTVDFCVPSTGKCVHTAKPCNDGDSCTNDSCAAESGICQHQPSPVCPTKIDKAGYQQSFHCGAKSLDAWTLISAAPGAKDPKVAPKWAVDATPAKPGFQSADCSLNFNNGTDYACPAGATKVSGTATSPWLDASAMAAGGDLRMTLRYSGRWESNNNDELHVLVSTDGQKWTKLLDVSATNTTYWYTAKVNLDLVIGQKFQLRVLFETKDCVDNDWTGPFIDDIKIWDATCAKAADCDDSNACTKEACNNGKCQLSSVNCNDGDPCTNDGCQAATGCYNSYKGEGAACSDSDTCTSTDLCASGKCVGKPTGVEGAKCSDGKNCTSGDVCTGGKCVGKENCDDTNPCTVDTCNPLNGACKWTVKSCDDGKPCVTSSCDGKTGVCKAVAKSCDDQDICTSDVCDAKTGACSHGAVAACKDGVKVPHFQPFDCGSPGSKAWSFQSGPGAAWAVDGMPALPKPRSPACTLNFNNGKDYACAPGQSKVSSWAMSPWIDATGVPKYANTMRARFWMAGKWYGKTGDGKYDGDSLEVAATLDGSKWQVVYNTVGNSTNWSQRAVALTAFAGAKFRLRFRLHTKDCNSNLGSGPFIDDLQIRDERCQQDGDCDDGKLCTTDHCANYNCTAKSVICNDGDPCTSDGCHAATGACSHPPRPDGSTCKATADCSSFTCYAAKCVTTVAQDGQDCFDGDTCTTGDKCAAGVCEGSAGATEGIPCADGDRCTTLDACAKGSCKGILGSVDTESTAGLSWSSPYALAIDAQGAIYGASWGHHQLRRYDGKKFVIWAGTSAGLVDGPKGKAKFKYPAGLDADNKGGIWVADRGNHVIRKVAGGQVSTVAGKTKGDKDGKGALAQFNDPWDVTVDAQGVAWVADSGNHLIRRIAEDGSVTTVAGSVAGFVDGKGAAVRFNRPIGVTTDGKGQVLVADQNNHRIRRVAADGTVITVAGTNYGHADAIGPKARFRYPHGIERAKDGQFYIADRSNSDIRRMDANWAVFTITGRQGGGYVDGALSGARFNSPADMVVDAKGVIWVADRGNSRIRRIYLNMTGNVCDDGKDCTNDLCVTATGKCDNAPSVCSDDNACTLDSCGGLGGKCIHDAYGCSDGDICTTDSCDKKAGCKHTKIAGCASCQGKSDCDDSDACTTDACSPTKGCTHGAIAGCKGCKLPADCDDGTPCTVDACDAAAGKCSHLPSAMGIPCDDASKCTAGDQCLSGDCSGVHGSVALRAGSNKAGSSDGPGPAASFNGPAGIVFGDKGQLYIADASNNRIRVLTLWGQVTRIAGLNKGFADGHYNSARFSGPKDVAVAADGALYIADTGNHRIRRFHHGWEANVTTAAGSGKAELTNGVGQAAAFNAPAGIVGDATGRLYVSDTGNHSVRVIAPGFKVSTLAGNGKAGGADGKGASASFSSPSGLDLDGKGYLWLADTGNSRIRRISVVDGTTISVAGGPLDKSVGPNPIAPMDVSLGADGWLYVADVGHGGLLRMAPAGHRALLSTPGQPGEVDGPLWQALWNLPVSAAVAADGAIWVSETGSHRIRRVAAVASVCSDGMTCTGDYCDIKTGACAWGPAQATSCDDGNHCTVDWCDIPSGTCAHAAVPNCP